MEPTIIDGIRCYAPELAFDNTGYHPDAHETLAKLERSNFWYVARNNILKSLFRRFLNEKDTEFLEVGCGNGIVLSALSELKYLKLTGADIYLSGLKYARTIAPSADYIQINAENIPFENKFHAIGCFDVLEHIEADTIVLSQIHKALKAGGLVILTVPEHPWLWSEIDEIDRHKRRYTKKELAEKTKAAGFEIIQINHFACSVFPIAVLSRMMRRRNKKNYKITDSPVLYPEINIPAPVNAILRFIMLFDELLYSMNIRLPFGSSLVLVGKKTTIPS